MDATETILVTTPVEPLNLFLPGGWTVRVENDRIVGFDAPHGFVPATTMDLDLPSGPLKVRFGNPEE